MRLLVHDSEHVLVLKDLATRAYVLPHEAFWPVHKKKPKAYFARRLFQNLTFNLFSFEFKSRPVFGLEDKCFEHSCNDVQSICDQCNKVYDWLKYTKRPVLYKFKVLLKREIEYKKLDVYTSLVFRDLGIQ